MLNLFRTKIACSLKRKVGYKCMLPGKYIIKLLIVPRSLYKKIVHKHRRLKIIINLILLMYFMFVIRI